VSAERLACFGWVDEHAGSASSAGYLVLAELLRRGIAVDLFAHREHVPPPAALISAGLRYFGFSQPGWLNGIDRLPTVAAGASRRALRSLVARSWRQILEPAVRAQHARAPYDTVLTLATTPAFAIPGVPAVTWLQGPFHTELAAIRRLRPQITAVSGRLFYLAVSTYYRYDQIVTCHGVIPSDRLVLPSVWSRNQMVAAGAPAETTHAVPYPLDLEAFSPGPSGTIDWDRPVLLSLGRLDPRKRLDLLLDAFALVRERRREVRLQIIGRPGYAPRQLSVLEDFAHRSSVDYLPPVPRQQVPLQLRRAAVLVQTSENENFGSAVAEALACGTPAVVGPSNGTAAYLDENSTAFDRYTPESVAEAVIRTLDRHREAPEEVARTTRASAERWFSAARVTDQLVEIIGAAIADRATPR
jgi:glycosyltransferase involved in cell wall biosynthesis